MKYKIKLIIIIALIIVLSISVYSVYDGPELRAQAIQSSGEIVKSEILWISPVPIKWESMLM